MKLVDVYSLNPDYACTILFNLLSEREDHQNISHKEMPSYNDHKKFVLNKPYDYWFLVEVEDGVAGAVYLTRNREVGIGIFKSYRGCGYAAEAIKALMALHPGGFLANINPKNKVSINLFEKLGFSKIPQVTYAKP